jgi:phosphoribosyl 1,2-cyclic phosphate phosphodiesterase
LKQEFHYIFEEHKYPGVPDLALNLIDEEPFLVGDIMVTPIKVWHLNMPVLGFRFGNFTYITDANRIEESVLQKIKGSEILVLNALRHQPHISHFTLQQAIDLATSLQIPKAFFTHISHQLGLHEEVSKSLSSNCELAYDSLCLNI